MRSRSASANGNIGATTRTLAPSACVEATAIASERSKYWQRNRPGGEEDLKRLGLKLRPPRTM